MKKKYLILTILFFLHQLANACPVCEKQQPQITQGLTHGTGPQSNWDWVIIGIISGITLITFIFSLKYLIQPGEKNSNHIKQTILEN